MHHLRNFPIHQGSTSPHSTKLDHSTVQNEQEPEEQEIEHAPVSNAKEQEEQEMEHPPVQNEYEPMEQENPRNRPTTGKKEVVYKVPPGCGKRVKRIWNHLYETKCHSDLSRECIIIYHYISPSACAYISTGRKHALNSKYA